jgi:hypothetical protein
MIGQRRVDRLPKNADVGQKSAGPRLRGPFKTRDLRGKRVELMLECRPLLGRDFDPARRQDLGNGRSLHRGRSRSDGKLRQVRQQGQNHQAKRRKSHLAKVRRWELIVLLTLFLAHQRSLDLDV